MKCFIILSFVCLIAAAVTQSVNLSDEQKAKVKSDLEDCIKEENVSAADADRIGKWDFENPSDSMKCVGACYLEKLGALKDNKVQEENVSQKLTPIIGAEKTNAILQGCKDVQGANRCDMGFKIFECVWKFKDA